MYQGRHALNMAAMKSAAVWCCTCSSICQLPTSLPSACDVTGSLYALQLLIHKEKFDSLIINNNTQKVPTLIMTKH